MGINELRPYIDQSGTSGIESYRLSRHFVDIKFRSSDKVYRYVISEVGEKYFLMMKEAARLGSHLNRVVNMVKQINKSNDN